MKVCIHRGTQEIGGTCIEIEAKGKRIVLDVGLPLDAGDTDNTETLLPRVNGFLESDPTLLAILISHPHIDHFGLTEHIQKEVPLIIGKAAHNILKAASNFSPYGIDSRETIFLNDRKVLEIGPFKITPFLVDHSAYDAYSILIESDGIKLFYSGDFRAHGRKAKLFHKLIQNPPNDIDVLLMEGTTIGRRNHDEKFPTEDDLISDFVELFKSTKGMCLVWCSGQNIDRIVTAYKACKIAGRQFIADMYTAEILRATENPNLPQGHWNGIKVFLPKSQKYRVIQQKLFDMSNQYKPYRIYPENLPQEASNSAMIFRPSMFKDLEEAGCLDHSSLAYSLWEGYLKMDQQKEFLDKLEKHRIEMKLIHTSGHASVSDLKIFANAIKAKKLVPIHSFETDQFPDLFNNVELKQDGAWWDVCGPKLN
jgi:ribonuclease J